MLANTHINSEARPHSGWELLRDGFPDRPEIGPALSRVLLEQVSAGERPATIRLSRPGRVVAFGRRDVVAPGYMDAVVAASGRGFPGMERISGGRAAAFTEGALSLTMTIPDADPTVRTEDRFRIWSGLLRQSFADLGVDARIGAVPGEYCPGEYSVNSAGRIKLAGAGQRMIRGAAHVGFVILVNNSALARDVLGPVYSALNLDYDGNAVGSLEDVLPGVTLDETEEVILKRLNQHLDHLAVTLEPVALDSATLIEAENRARGFRSPVKPE